MSASTATGQHSRPDMLIVTLIHQSLPIDAARLASALAAVGPGDRAGRVAAIGAFYGRYRGQRCGCSTGSLRATTAGPAGSSPVPPDGRGSRKNPPGSTRRS
jgi:hypothetical protein